MKLVYLAALLLCGAVVACSQISSIETVNLESSAIPVTIGNISTYVIYDSELQREVMVTNYLVSNTSALYIGRFFLIGYALDGKGKEVSTTFWSETEGLGPFQTKLFTSYDSLEAPNVRKRLWVIHGVCTDSGSFEIDFSDLRKAIFPYKADKVFSLPTTLSFRSETCPPDSFN